MESLLQWTAKAIRFVVILLAISAACIMLSACGTVIRSHAIPGVGLAIGSLWLLSKSVSEAYDTLKARKEDTPDAAR